MRIRYLKEGFFKNPEQAKAAREKERELSNAEKIAGVSNKLIKEPLIKFINDTFDLYYHGKWHSSSYTVGFWSDTARRDHFNVGPDFMSPYCIVKDKDVMYMNYTLGKTVVNDINFDEMTIDITTTIGTPTASHSVGSITPKVASNDSVAYASYYDKLYGIAEVAGFETGNYSFKSPFAGTNKNLLMHKICYLFLTDLFNELKDNPHKNEYEKNILEIVNALNFDHTKFKYNIKIEWNLQEDVIIFPVMTKDAADLNNARDAEEEALEYMHQMFYPNLEYTNCYKPYKERYGTDYITPSSLIKCMTLLYGSTPMSIVFTTSNIKKHVHSMEDLAALYTESLKNQDIEITGPGHLYLSTGYFKKDYLIA